jgi:hypothetical protein
VQGAGAPPPGADVPAASALLEADFEVTISGGSGPAFYQSCVFTHADHTLFSGGSSDVNVSFGSVFVDTFDSETGVDTCGHQFGLFGFSPFTFGQPFIVHGRFSAEASSHGPAVGDVVRGVADVYDFEAFSCAFGCGFSDIIPGTTFTVSVVPAPEGPTVPSVLVVLGVGGLKRKLSGIRSQPGIG